MKQNNETILIIGGGFLGKRLAERDDSESCYFTRRPSQQTANQGSQQFGRLSLDINQPDSWASLDSLQDHASLRLFCLVPPSKIELQCFERFIEHLQSFSVSRAIMSSSTVVYGTQQRTVSAESEVVLDTERARKQFELESRWQAFGERAYIVRLAGLYGPGRVIGESTLNNRQQITSNPNAVLNLIHVNDAASLLEQLSVSEMANRIELACDNSPVQRREYYEYLSQLFHLPSPTFNETGQWSGADRQCDNKTTRERLLWQAEFPSYREGLKDCYLMRNSNNG